MILGLSVDKISYQDEWKDVATDSNDVIEKLTEDQDVSRAFVTDFQVTIAQREDKLAINEEAFHSIKITAPENKPRILKVFGGGTFRSGSNILNDVDTSTIENLMGEYQYLHVVASL
ncbi:MAG: hypothetical protein OEX11_03510 [Nitrosomonas sp.]|nr:hypothetical protein [Nitrosomonas sp.]